MLWQRNYLPALSTTAGQEIGESGRALTREAQWRLHDDGLLQPLYAVLDLYVVAEVERFSQLDETTGWYCITPASLQKALESGMSLEYILRFLQNYSVGGIPGSLLIRLKLWGSGYDQQQIYVESAPLLRLSVQVLQDLQSDQEIQSLLGSEVEQQQCLVRVEASQLERILALLRMRGFDVE
jgi:Helicase conserved C-terminal domain